MYLFISIFNIVFHYFYFHSYNMFRIAGTLLVPVYRGIVSPPGVDDNDNSDAAVEVQTRLRSVTKTFTSSR